MLLMPLCRSIQGQTFRLMPAIFGHASLFGSGSFLLFWVCWCFFSAKENQIKSPRDDGSIQLFAMPKNCEIIEVRNSADELGFPCSRTASKECSDCGIQLCEDHAEPCGTCFSIFCPPCRFLHRGQHSKPAHGERRERKRA